MNWFKLECTTRAFVTALQLTVRYEMSVIIIIIIINYQLSVVAKDVVRSSLELHKEVMCRVCTNLGKSLKVLDVNH